MDIKALLNNFDFQLRGMVLPYEKFANTMLDVPYKRVFDLAYFGEILITSDSKVKTNIKVTNKVLKLFDMSEEEIFDIIEKNALKQVSLVPLGTACSNLLRNEMDDCSDPIFNDPEMSSVMVLGVNDCFHGAAAIANMDILKMVYDKFGKHDFYILPSSIHELIVLPKSESGDFSVAELRSMVSDINNSIVCPEERLSYNVYYFDGNELALA